jgi:hypothetical protein
MVSFTPSLSIDQKFQEFKPPSLDFRSKLIKKIPYSFTPLYSRNIGVSSDDHLLKD